MSPPENANARLCLTGRVRKTDCNDKRRLNPALAPVKSAVVDFVQHPTFTAFRRAFPHLFRGHSAHGWKDQPMSDKNQGGEK
jgi:hypothetical protein